LIFVHNKEIGFAGLPIKRYAPFLLGFNATRISAYPVVPNAVQSHRVSVLGTATRTTEGEEAPYAAVVHRSRLVWRAIRKRGFWVAGWLEVDRCQLDKVFGRMRLVRYSG